MSRSKKVLLALAICFFGICVVVVSLAKAWIDVRQARQAAIIAVMNDYRRDLVQHRTLRNGKILVLRAGDLDFSEQLFLQRIGQISTVACPEPFQQAWLTYVQTCQRRNFIGWLAANGEVVVSAVKPNGDSFKDGMGRLDRMDPREAWMRLQHVALRYGVQLH